MDGNLGGTLFTPVQMESESPHWDTSFSKGEMGQSVTEPERRFGGCWIHTRSQLLGDVMRHPCLCPGACAAYSEHLQKQGAPATSTLEAGSACHEARGVKRTPEFLLAASLFRTSPLALLKIPR